MSARGLSGTLDVLDLHPDGSSILFSSAVNPKIEVWVLEGVSAVPRQR